MSAAPLAPDLDELMAGLWDGHLTFREFRLQVVDRDLLLGTQFQHLRDGLTEEVRLFDTTLRQRLTQVTSSLAGKRGPLIRVLLHRVHRDLKHLTGHIVHPKLLTLHGLSPRYVAAATLIQLRWLQSKALRRRALRQRADGQGAS